MHLNVRIEAEAEAEEKGDTEDDEAAKSEAPYSLGR